MVRILQTLQQGLEPKARAPKMTRERFPWHAAFTVVPFFIVIVISFDQLASMYCVYRVSQEECARLREGVPYVKVYRYNPKHLCPNLNGYGDNGQRSLKL